MKQLLTFISIFLLFFYACERDNTTCEEMKTTYKYLTPVSLERTRYFTDPTFDTIKFKSNKGDTLIFVKTDCDSSWFDDYKSWNDPECGPYENIKYLQITNSYKTIKGEGLFEVKHSLRAYLEGVLNPQDYVIEIKFLGNNFNFYEQAFGLNTHPNFIGNFTVGDTTYLNVFYVFSNFNSETKVKGYMAPQFGLINIQDSMNLVSYDLIK